MEKVFLGLVWENDKTPLFHIKTPDANKDEYIYIPQLLSLKNLHNRACVGTINPLTLTYESCSNKVDGNNCQCNKCKFKFEFYKCVRCHGDNCNVNNKFSKDYCETPHLVYLAYFPNGKIKVGTASLQRKESRLLEQGALYAIYMAKTPSGKYARQIEQEIISNGIAGMVSSAYKLKNLYYNESEEQVQMVLLNKFYELSNLISPIYKQYLLEPKLKKFNNILDIMKNYNLQINPMLDKNNFIIEKNVNDIRGKFAFAIGKILALEINDTIKLIDTKKVEGCIFDFNDKMMIEFCSERGKEYGR